MLVCFITDFITDAYDLDGSSAGVKSVITEDMEEEVPPAKEPGEQIIIIGKKCPFLFPLQGLKCRTTHLYLSHFAYTCKMRYPLNLVLENSEYLWFYWTFCIVILDYGLKLHVMLQKWLEIH